MFQIIGLLLLGIIVGIIFSYLRGKILSGVIRNVNTSEKFNSEKFKAGLVQLNDKVKWARDFVNEFNLRKVIIHLSILLFLFSIIAGVFYYKGRMNSPIQINLAYEKEFKMKLDGDYLHKPKNSQELMVVDDKGNVIKEIKVKDIPELKKRLKVFDFQLVPIFVAGGGIGDGIEGELGAGISWLRYFQWRIENFLTQKGIYLGTSYKFKQLENSAIGVAIGKGYKEGDSRVLFYWRWRF